MKRNIICLMGPTGSGKSVLAIELAKIFPFTIINVDSTLVYRGMNIGTAKPSPQELNTVPHELINICEVNEIYSAGQFCLDAHVAIEKTFAQGRIPLLVGGTMMYFHALQFGLDQLPNASPALRAQLSQQAAEQGWPKMHERLQQLAPERAAKIHPRDAQRIQRALEIVLLTPSVTPPLLRGPDRIQNDEVKIEFKNILLIPTQRPLLRARIAERFDQMLINGFIDEVKKFFVQTDIHENLPAMRAVGYRQVWQHLQGQYDFSTMREKAITATCQLAKRQMTWLKRYPTGTCFAAEDSACFRKIETYIHEFNKTNLV